MRILIVEDQESLAKTIRDGLKSKGFAADYLNRRPKRQKSHSVKPH